MKLLYLLCFLAMNAPLGQPPTTGLVAYYPFNGNANDESGRGNHGVVQQASLTTDRFGKPGRAYRFSDGARIRVPNSPSLQFKDRFTFSGWMKLRTYAGRDGRTGAVSPLADHILFSKDCDRDWLILALNSKPNSRATLTGGNGKGSVATHLPLSLNTWYHVAISYNRPYIWLYINGLASASAYTLLDFSAANRRDLIIGSAGCWPFFFSGDLDDFRFYNRALTETDILTLYNAEKPQ